MFGQREAMIVVQDSRSFLLRAVLFLPLLLVTLGGFLVQALLMPFASIAKFGLIGGILAALGGVIVIAINLVLIPIASVVWLLSGQKTVPESVARSLERDGWRIVG